MAVEDTGAGVLSSWPASPGREPDGGAEDGPAETGNSWTAPGPSALARDPAGAYRDRWRDALTRGPTPAAGTAPSDWRDRPAHPRAGMTADWTGGSFFMSLIQLRDLKKTYKTGKLEFEALKGVDLEGLFLAFLGWVVGIPLGWVVYGMVAAAMASGMKLTLPDKFALMYVGWSFVFAMVGTLIVIFLPLRRATNMKPGDAIR
jgi:hypothetical protein